MGNRIRVLIADTACEHTSALSAALGEAADLELVSVVSTGKEVLSLCERLCPDVLLLELILPELDGLGVLQKLSNAECKPLCIVCTNFVTPRSVSMATELGADYFLSKPCSAGIVLERIRGFAALRTVPVAVPKLVSVKSPKPTPTAVEESAIAELLRNLGVPAQLKGYQYLREAIAITIRDGGELQMVTKCLYPTIAKRFSTTSSRVERAIRHAIELSWCRGNEELLRSCFGSSVGNGKPTNSQFIASLSERLMLGGEKVI